MRRGLDGFSCFLPSSSAVFKLHGGRLEHFRWRDSERETPLPIPNRAVKPLSADGTWRATSRESRSPPVFSGAAPRGGSFSLGFGCDAATRFRGLARRADWPGTRPRRKGHNVIGAIILGI